MPIGLKPHVVRARAKPKDSIDEAGEAKKYMHLEDEEPEHPKISDVPKDPEVAEDKAVHEEPEDSKVSEVLKDPEVAEDKAVQEEPDDSKISEVLKDPRCAEGPCGD